MNEVLQKLFLVIAFTSITLLTVFPTTTTAEEHSGNDQHLITNGDVESFYKKGQMYEERGPNKNIKEAEKWYRLAAERGHSEAQFSLGRLYEKGYVFEIWQDSQEAKKWYKLAAMQGNVSAQKRLGEMYEDGLGIPQNYVKAIKWYGMAANQGDINAQRKLGLCYIKFEEDYIKAYAWLSMAANQGSKLSKKKRDEISTQMTPGQISEANNLINLIIQGKVSLYSQAITEADTITGDRVEFQYYKLSIKRPPEDWETQEKLGVGEIVVWQDANTLIAIHAGKQNKNLSFHDMVELEAKLISDGLRENFPNIDITFKIVEENEVVINNKQFLKAKIIHEYFVYDRQTVLYYYRSEDFDYMFTFIDERYGSLTKEMMQSVIFYE